MQTVHTWQWELLCCSIVWPVRSGLSICPQQRCHYFIQVTLAIPDKKQCRLKLWNCRQWLLINVIWLLMEAKVVFVLFGPKPELCSANNVCQAAVVQFDNACITILVNTIVIQFLNGTCISAHSSIKAH